MSQQILASFGFAAILLLFSCKNDPKPMVSAAQQVDPAIDALSKQLEQTPDNDSLLFRRAEVYYQLDAFDEALADLQKAMNIDSMQPVYYHLLADVLLDYARPNDSKRAIDVLTLCAQRFPGRIPTLLKLSEFQLIVQKHNDALASISKILEQDPQNADAYFMTGRVALDMGDTARSVTAFQKSVQLDASIPDAWVFLGRIYSNKNDPRAVQFFDNALRLDSTLLEAREFKGAFYKRRGAFDKAFEVYRDIVVRNPDYSNAYFDMGMIYLELDSLNKAYDHFNIAIKTDPLFVKAFYYRGVSSESMGNAEAAYADYVQAYKMSPNYVPAKEAVERLEKTLKK